jgi:hypothetical protein
MGLLQRPFALGLRDFQSRRDQPENTCHCAGTPANFYFVKSFLNDVCQSFWRERRDVHSGHRSRLQIDRLRCGFGFNFLHMALPFLLARKNPRSKPTTAALSSVAVLGQCRTRLVAVLLARRPNHCHSKPRMSTTSCTSISFVVGPSCRLPPPGRVIFSCHLTGGSFGVTFYSKRGSVFLPKMQPSVLIELGQRQSI